MQGRQLLRTSAASKASRANAVSGEHACPALGDERVANVVDDEVEHVEHNRRRQLLDDSTQKASPSLDRNRHFSRRIDEAKVTP